jgi:fumarylacetoacetase
MPAVKRSAVRKTIIALLSDKNSELFKDPMLNSEAFFKMQDAQMHLPMRVGDFSDFMCSRTHVDNVGSCAFIFRF